MVIPFIFCVQTTETYTGPCVMESKMGIVNMHFFCAGEPLSSLNSQHQTGATPTADQRAAAISDGCLLSTG